MNGVSAKPEKEFKVGAVRAAVWSNPRHTADGKMFTSHKVVVERVYKDARGSFQTTDSLDVNDIPKAILALKRAYEFLVLREPAKDSGETQPVESFKVGEAIP